MTSPTRLSRLAEGLMEACWLAALILTPLFFDIFSSRIFEPDKVALLRSLALIIAAAWAIKLIDQSRPPLRTAATTASTGRRAKSAPASPSTPTAPTSERFGPRIRTFLRLPLVAPTLATIVIVFLGVALSVAPRTSLAGSYQRAQGAYTTLAYLIVFAAVYANMRRQAQVERLVTAIILTSLPIAVYGILQRLSLDPLPWGADTVERVTSTMGNAIFIAAYLIMACLLTVGRFVQSLRLTIAASAKARLAGERKPRSPVFAALTGLYGLIILAQLTTIYFSGSRGPWLGLLAGLK